MGWDAAMGNASAPAVPRDGGGKKKRNNRSAKLKQCKFDARREQWLSQLKNKSCEVANGHALSPSMSPLPLTLPLMRNPDAPPGGPHHVMPRRENGNRTTGLRDSDMDSPINSPTCSVSGNDCSGKDFPANSISSGSCSRSVSDADEEDINREGGGEEGQDDWEAVADSLTANGGGGQSRPRSEHAVTVPELTGYQESRKGNGILKTPQPNRIIPRAWSPDDLFRPQSLPNLSKQHRFPVNLKQYSNQGATNWVHHGIITQACSCPICYEDLDLTDSSFLPCSCGFHLCLFCHKRILETDGRCPGCRKQYSQVEDGDMGISVADVPLLSLHLSRFRSMRSRP